MWKNGKSVVAAAMVVSLAAAACSSSSKSSAGSTGGGHTLTVGIITDVTGPAASGNKSSIQGMEAAANTLAKNAGYHLNFVIGDSQTSPAAVLAAAKKLVLQDHVAAVLPVSAVMFGAASYLTQQGVPVVGAPEDGPEWIPSHNMFPIYGYLDTTKVGTTTGDFFKMEGVNVVGAIGYSISPSSAEAAKSAAAASQQAGLKVGYLNANFPFGSTNVQPEALAMKSAGVDGYQRPARGPGHEERRRRRLHRDR
jgi:ABC-type branched-subunit amino acid transport system substrate-binding protein